MVAAVAEGNKVEVRNLTAHSPNKNNFRALKAEIKQIIGGGNLSQPPPPTLSPEVTTLQFSTILGGALAARPSSHKNCFRHSYNLNSVLGERRVIIFAVTSYCRRSPTVTTLTLSGFLLLLA